MKTFPLPLSWLLLFHLGVPEHQRHPQSHATAGGCSGSMLDCPCLAACQPKQQERWWHHFSSVCLYSHPFATVSQPVSVPHRPRSVAMWLFGETGSLASHFCPPHFPTARLYDGTLESLPAEVMSQGCPGSPKAS